MDPKGPKTVADDVATIVNASRRAEVAQCPKIMDNAIVPQDRSAVALADDLAMIVDAGSAAETRAPSAPRSLMTPPSHMKARKSPDLVSLPPTI